MRDACTSEVRDYALLYLHSHTRLPEPTFYAKPNPLSGARATLVASAPREGFLIRPTVKLIINKLMPMLSYLH
ncbi:hypothetical protein Krac_8936 [Ktedonobacter racemifer DSM 44963]|uniref:Uncharacterized protein n=1 Tax=Ktedonobacter racemifer DSM 44963 TaxID=485913 RepID=D6TQ08_KTERA|nr:hypothetical protein Krac_8936 [Ktedonobacter racemifer DSM 44963]